MIEGPRAVRQKEFKSLAQLVNTVFRPEGGDMYADYPQLFNAQNLDNLRVMVDNGRVVSHIGILLRDVAIYGCRLTAGCIGAVATAEEYRGQGLASKLLHDSFAKIEEAGGSLILISGGRGLYLRNDCVPVSRARQYEISCLFADENADRELLLGVFSAEKILNASALYRREPVRFLRPQEDYGYFLESGKAMNCSSDFWLIQRKNQTVAYAVVQRATTSAAPSIVEYAGDRRAIIGSLAKIIKSSGGTDSLNLYVPVADEPFYWQLQYLGLTPVGRKMVASGTVRIQSFSRFLECMYSYLAEILGSSTAEMFRVEDSGSEITFYLEKEKLTLSRDDATALVFGTPENKEHQILKKHRGFVVEVLSKIFPLPAPWYGLNYV